MNKFQAALHHARKLINSGDAYYICDALNSVKLLHQNLADAVSAVKLHIRKNLVTSAGFETNNLTSWLRLEVGFLPTPTQLQLARLAWIDKLMETYK